MKREKKGGGDLARDTVHNPNRLHGIREDKMMIAGSAKVKDE